MKYLSIKNRGSELTIAVTLRPTNFILQDGVNIPQLFDDITKLVSSKTTPNTTDESVKPPIQILSTPPKTDGIFKSTNSGGITDGKPTGGIDSKFESGKEKFGSAGSKDDFKKVVEPINTVKPTDTGGSAENKSVSGNPGDVFKKQTSFDEAKGDSTKKEVKNVDDKFQKLEKPTAGMTVEDFKFKWKFDDTDFADWLKFEYPKLTESEKANLTHESWKPFLGGKVDGKN
jgi:hypothetical protein